MLLHVLQLCLLVQAGAYNFLPPGVPEALPSQVVVSGDARFTVLTKHLIRLVR